MKIAFLRLSLPDRLSAVVPLVAATLAVIASSGQKAEATSVSTVPQGYLTVNIAAGNATTPSVTQFSLPLSQPVPSTFVGIAAGQITGVGTASIINSNGGWSAGALSQAATPYFIRITSGAAQGQTFQISTTNANTSTTLNLVNQNEDLTTLGINSGTNGDTYQIIPGDTLLSLFGTDTLGSTSSAEADIVEYIVNGVQSDFYYNTSVGQWRKTSGPALNENNNVLRPDAGITFYRKGSAALQYALLGAVPSTNIQIVVNNTGSTYVGNPFPVDQTLGAVVNGTLTASNYKNFSSWINNPGTGTLGFSTITLLVGTVFNPYNYNSAVGHWRKGSLGINQDGVVIPAGTPITITQPSTTTGTSVLTCVMPYNLN
jgi:hypothetical protein